jgi:hypothetical protein
MHVNFQYGALNKEADWKQLAYIVAADKAFGEFARAR